MARIGRRTILTANHIKERDETSPPYVDLERGVILRYYSLTGEVGSVWFPETALRHHALLLWREAGSPDDMIFQICGYVRIKRF